MNFNKKKEQNKERKQPCPFEGYTFVCHFTLWLIFTAFAVETDRNVSKNQDKQIPFVKEK